MNKSPSSEKEYTVESYKTPTTHYAEALPQNKEVSEAFHYYELVENSLNLSRVANRFLDLADHFRDVKDTIKGNGRRVGATIALMGAGTLVLTGCVNHPDAAADTPKPHHTTSQEATPSSTPTPSETPSVPEHAKDPLPAALEQAHSETLQEFNNEQWDTKLAYMSWLENQAISPQEFASQVQHMKTANPYANVPLPAASPTNTPEEIVTIDNYQMETVFAQNNILDAQKMLDALFSHGTNSVEYSYWEPLLEQQLWPAASPQAITTQLDSIPVESIESATAPVQDAVGEYEVDVTWPGTPLGNYGYLPRATGGTINYIYHTYKDYKGNDVSSWFAE